MSDKTLSGINLRARSARFLNFPRMAHSPIIVSIPILPISLRNSDFSVKTKSESPLRDLGPNFPNEDLCS